MYVVGQLGRRLIHGRCAEIFASGDDVKSMSGPGTVTVNGDDRGGMFGIADLRAFVDARPDAGVVLSRQDNRDALAAQNRADPHRHVPIEGVFGVTGIRCGAGAIARFGGTISVGYRRIDDVGVAAISAVVSRVENDHSTGWYGSGMPCRAGFWRCRGWRCRPFGTVRRAGAGGRRIGGRWISARRWVGAGSRGRRRRCFGGSRAWRAGVVGGAVDLGAGAQQQPGGQHGAAAQPTGRIGHGAHLPTSGYAGACSLTACPDRRARPLRWITGPLCLVVWQSTRGERPCNPVASPTCSS